MAEEKEREREYTRVGVDKIKRASKERRVNGEMEGEILHKINEFSEPRELRYLETAAEPPGFPPPAQRHMEAPPPPCGCRETGTDGRRVPPVAERYAELWGPRPALRSDLRPAPASPTCDKQPTTHHDFPSF